MSSPPVTRMFRRSALDDMMMAAEKMAMAATKWGAIDEFSLVGKCVDLAEVIRKATAAPAAIFHDIPILKSEDVPECPGCGKQVRRTFDTAKVGEDLD